MKKLNILAIIIGLVCLISAVSYSQMRSSIEQYGITWTFDKEYETGQFVNGDYWVKGPVTVTAISPRTSICTAEERGDIAQGALWWSGTYWCLSSAAGTIDKWTWRKYNENPVGVYSWYEGELNKTRPDRDSVLSTVEQTFSNYAQNGDFQGNIYAADSTGITNWDSGIYIQSAGILNGKPVYIKGHLMHGSMINPNSGSFHGLDSHQINFLPSLVKTPPIKLTDGMSLLTAKSIETAPASGLTDGMWPGDKETWTPDRRSTEAAAVLTILDETPAGNSFRPPFYGLEKPLFSANAINWNLLPKKLPPQFVTNPNYNFEDIYTGRNLSYATIADQYGRFIQRPWISFGVHRELHPSQNMPGYHREVWRLLQNVAVLLCVDIDAVYGDPGSNGEIKKLVIPFIQMGIDVHYMCKNQAGDSSVSRWPTLFAGLMLDHEPFKNIAIDKVWLDRMGRQVYYRNEATSRFVSNVVPQDKFYHGHKVGWRQDPANEHEHLDPATEWGPEWGTGSGQGGLTREAYRDINSPAFVGNALAAHLFDAKDLWNLPALFDYAARWMDLERQSSDSLFIDKMWAVYKNISPEMPPETNNPDIINESSVTGKTGLKILNNVIRGSHEQSTVRLMLAEAGAASVKIFDSKGKQTITLWDGHKEAGVYDIPWNGADSSGKKVGSGVYMVHMKSGSYTETKKIVIVR